ncbi:unnamed protein product [Protopolystoma xenopodis]|uniref:Uncharacterized protein n=1 Tax=Protopolystoma xenopodis TaxID=117903 RepID=A0A3S5FCW0_9PLAT|nr:unnamed protein product [Protopolystoma xenopodis]
MTDEMLACFHRNRGKFPRKQCQHEGYSKNNKERIKRSLQSSSGWIDQIFSLEMKVTVEFTPCPNPRSVQCPGLPSPFFAFDSGSTEAGLQPTFPTQHSVATNSAVVIDAGRRDQLADIAADRLSGFILAALTTNSSRLTPDLKKIVSAVGVKASPIQSPRDGPARPSPQGHQLGPHSDSSGPDGRNNLGLYVLLCALAVGK